MRDAACGIEYLHSLDIVHGGVNPVSKQTSLTVRPRSRGFRAQGNVLITDNGRACIGDFQIAAIITDPEVKAQCQTTMCRRGIVRYMAPEQVDPRRVGQPNSNPTKATDVHSLAMTAYEVCSFRVGAHDSVISSLIS